MGQFRLILSWLPSTDLTSKKRILKCCVMTGGNIVRINLNILCLNLSFPLVFAETPLIIPSGESLSHNVPKGEFKTCHGTN